jgi:DNA-binding NarL/FixJ family response regulator
MNNKNNKIQVFVISQQSLFQQAVEHTFSDTEDIVIIGTTSINGEVMKAIDNLPPDVALLDLDGPSDNALELARRIRQRSPNIGVIVLTSIRMIINYLPH